MKLCLVAIASFLIEITCIAEAQSPNVRAVIFPAPQVINSGCSQATSFLARTSGLSANYQTQYTIMICGLVTDGVWAKFDAFYVFKTSSQANALLNLVSSSFNATITGTPTFTADSGFSSGSNSNYVDTNLNSATAGGNATQNAFHFSVWNNAAGAGDGNGQIGASATEHIYAAFASNAYFRIGNGTGISALNTVAAGFYLGNRSDSLSTQGYKNGVSIVTSAADPSVALTSIDWTFPATSGVAGTADLLLGGSIGGNLSSTDVSNFYSRFNTFLSNVP